MSKQTIEYNGLTLEVEITESDPTITPIVIPCGWVFVNYGSTEDDENV